MIYLISPAKTMKENKKELPINVLFEEQSQKLSRIMKQYSLDQLKEMMKISDKIALQTYQMYQNMHYTNGSKAINLYDGMLYKAIDYEQLDKTTQQYLNEHVYIVSAMYGLVTFQNVIENYRLEMQTKMDVNLYEYWKETIVSYLNQHEVIVDLCSNEYKKGYEKELNTIEIVFKASGKKEPIKKLRGSFVRECALKQVQTKYDLKQIHVYGYCFDEQSSNEYQYVYRKD